MKILEREISLIHPPFVIAELSGNHGGNLDRALRIVDLVAESGADALKLQTYTADTMTPKSNRVDFTVKSSKSPWFGRDLYDLYLEAHTPWEWHQAIFDRARAQGLITFSSPFDETAVEFLEELDVPCYKVASFEITDTRLLRTIAATGKPVIVSTGMATRREVHTAINTLRQSGSGDIALLRCTSSYPASPRAANLKSIPDLRAWSGCEVGLSDHSIGVGVAIAAVALGATIIEKHVIDDVSMPTVDSSFSLQASDFRTLVQESRKAWEAIGSVHYGPTREEEASLQLRRSLFFSRDLKAGARIEPHHVRALRPAVGLPASDIDRVIGLRLSRDVARDEPVLAEFILLEPEK